MTVRLKLITKPRVTSLGQWTKLADGSWRCGNVMIVNVGEDGQFCRQDWRVFVLNSRRWALAEYSRKYGYSHAGQAKIGAALVAAHQRGVFK